jgi:beta-glucosidase
MARSPFAPYNPRLAGFARVKLKAGEGQRIDIPLDQELFTLINNEGQRVQASSAVLYVGGSQPDARSVELVGKAPIKLEVHS